ncbi:hypothetical protein HPP92_004253 [Vanilla planifolia]|uniref:Phytocyanin domain-containing protein n=1 Tax=Vanilla planifolia TaxID=51239 RepID=A0A835RFM8_VANPL|nr:hypothetical protein HPP92_004699 [Vanilla planifolia]KAG0493259.1 hypothetical protein HPP92_004253 [Vanilla planifolia]
MAVDMSATTPFLLLLLLVCSASVVLATDHIVGGHLGWNPNINYTLWSDNQTFYVNDFISFRYQKTMYNVFEVNETGYLNCTMDGVVGNWSSGKDFIALTRPGSYYFICGNGLCFSGMKVAIKVLPLPSPPPSPSRSIAGHSDSAVGWSRPPPVYFFAALAGAAWIAIWI